VASDRPAGELTVRVCRADPAAEALRRLAGQGLRVATIQLTQPSLDDVFLSLTGHPATASATAEES
jgi:ABC-2 type transport system ATP-binding protein